MKKALQDYVSGIAERVLAARIAAGLSQTKLAEMANVSQSHLSRLENGQQSPSHLTRSKIEKALGLEVGALTKEKAPTMYGRTMNVQAAERVAGYLVLSGKTFQGGYVGHYEGWGKGLYRLEVDIEDKKFLDGSGGKDLLRTKSGKKAERS